MPSYLARYATPLVTGLFMVSLISGVALFFHYGSAAFHGMHEWLSMVLIVPFVLHVWKNWRSFLNYFRRPPMATALGVSLVAALAFAWPALTQTDSGGGRPAQVAMLQTIENAPLATLAPVFGHDSEGLTTALRDKGYSVASADETPASVAKASGKSSRDVFGTLIEIKQ